jgi:hypothetical protein
MPWVRLASAYDLAARERLEPEFEVTHPQDELVGALAPLADQREDICGDTPQLLVPLRHAIHITVAASFTSLPAEASWRSAPVFH